MTWVNPSPELDDMYMNDNYRLKGCQSTVYFVSELNKDKTLSFKANSDAFIVKGLIALILKFLIIKVHQIY